MDKHARTLSKNDQNTFGPQKCLGCASREMELLQTASKLLQLGKYKDDSKKAMCIRTLGVRSGHTSHEKMPSRISNRVVCHGEEVQSAQIMSQDRLTGKVGIKEEPRDFVHPTLELSTLTLSCLLHLHKPTINLHCHIWPQGSYKLVVINATASIVIEDFEKLGDVGIRECSMDP